jgi:alcohol dehydrogenase class IV
VLTGDSRATVADGVAWVQDLCAVLDVPSLAAYGATAHDIPIVVEKTAVASSTQANPIKLGPEELGHILAQAL